ncbi:4-alpha-glucanotransferase [Globicatella sanguinis]|uniref:4-alpha-glucanotransferase n=1 Tax=Globicatella sanguinis TaxID=13076 RepID=UPI002543CF6B|nr:4-alpha-glucanotransferase [Globicatella sanguinis]MDK7630812.1 4-alpha-glucanotransferase [Globicatella sanguinis]WIK66968.1 4-alpha-glucanotransferase [Globicatella sanguinis]WKT56373.1 4-alpha-glucanotransferase [Globicatella sanguinis]
MARSSGVLMHISSLPNKFGIGTFGQSAYDFVDFLVRTKQTYWQILPLGTTSYGDSPYQSFSAIAGNPHFIDFELLSKEGLLEPADYEKVDFGDDPENVDYGTIFINRRPILEKAVANFLKRGKLEGYTQFVAENAHWLEDYAEYMAIKEDFGLVSWTEWDEDIRLRDKKALNEYRKKLVKEIEFHKVTQYFFFTQWLQLKAYANENDIQIIGDMPIYVSADSVEMWTNSKLFKVDEFKMPIVVAGTPPDNFSDDGQYWGNPIYDWEYMEKDKYSWWILRMKESFKIYDMVRIDHFRGFESYWAVPFGSPTAADGRWEKGPDVKLFKQIKKELGDLNIIAEDLGFLTQEVIDMRDATGFPGMKILQFGFDGTDSMELPHNYVRNTISYLGTHDNETITGWYQSVPEYIRHNADKYSNRKEDETIAEALNRTLSASVSDYVIFTMQDLLDLDNTARMNEPSTIGKNWKWRMKEDAITETIEAKLTDYTVTYFRANQNIVKKEAEKAKAAQKEKEKSKSTKKVAAKPKTKTNK